MIRRILGLGALVALLGPVSCLTDEGPDAFSTADSCVRGDVQGCKVTAKGHTGEIGVQTCGANLRFTGQECRAVGCTVFPDCGKCSDCFEKCMCQTFGKTNDCSSLCNGDGGGAVEADSGAAQIR